MVDKWGPYQMNIFMDEDAAGSKRWYKEPSSSNYHLEYHREDGPAIEHYDGSTEWFLNGKWHREDGPAVNIKPGFSSRHPRGIQLWYIRGKRVK